MTCNITSSYKDKTGKKTVIEHVKDYVDELPHSDFSKAATILFDKIDNGKAGVLPLSKFVYLIEMLREVFHSEELVGNMRKVNPNESCSLDRFVFGRWYVDKDVSLVSVEEAERLVGWG